MASTTGQTLGKSSQPTAVPTSANASQLLHEKNKIGHVRRATPDSQAVGSGSSDDEHDHLALGRVASNTSTQPKTARRASWLNEVNPLPQRKASFTGGSLSGNSQPPTPSTDANIWSTALGTSSGPSLPRVPPHPTAGRNDQSWNQPGKKEPPSRLKEVLPKPPSSQRLVNGNSGEHDNHILASPASQSSSNQGPMFDEAYPVHMPLQPTFKTYRSQSYSVGQMDPTNNDVSYPQPPPNMNGTRGGLPSSVRNRPSRPSLLSDKSHDKLGRVREVDDDDESANGSDQGIQVASIQAFSNTGQDAQMDPSDAQRARSRNRRATTSFFPSDNNNMDELASSMSAFGLGSGFSDFAVDDAEDRSFSRLNIAGNHLGRRMSEYGIPGAPSYQPTEFGRNPALEESIRRSQWTSSLSFGGIEEDPQSRRHSLADVPARRVSMYSADGRHGMGSSLQRHGEENVTSEQSLDRDYNDPRNGASQEEQALQLQHSHARTFAASYFSGAATTTRQFLASEPDASASFGDVNSYRVPQSLGAPRAAHTLHVVTFKCFRADVFYIQEGTGLKVDANDLVIVEADRGTDLGIVQHPNISWAEAKSLKERYAKEHYKCLMMFSRHSIAHQAGHGSGMLAMSNGHRASVTGGMGPQGSAQPGGQEPSTGELRPRMIRRQAQPHEVTTLQDKEGNEAKAKRVCQQKVIEHRLNMEILDAEFQMDWKKLTFYYFAEEYINFNNLVTDLFKMYKTRIWMSAINPASFAAPAAGLMSGVAPGSTSAPNPYGRGYSGGQRAVGSDNQYSNYGAFGSMVNPYQMYNSASADNPNRPLQDGSFLPLSSQVYDATNRGPATSMAYASNFTRTVNPAFGGVGGFGNSIYPPTSPQPFSQPGPSGGYGSAPPGFMDSYASNSHSEMNGFSNGPETRSAGLGGHQVATNSAAMKNQEQQNTGATSRESEHSAKNLTPSGQRTKQSK